MRAVADVERGRELHAAHAWATAHAALSAAEGAKPLAGVDLERLAEAAYMLGRDDEYAGALERAHHAHLEAGAGPRAVRCAFWLGLNLALRGRHGPAMGWFGRARRLLEREGAETVEHGYLLIPELLGHAERGDHEAAAAAAAQAAEIGERFDDRDLVALTVQEQGHALIRQGRREEGLRLLDEAMVAVTAGELSPIVTGLVYCNTIAFCQSVYEVRRARQWTEAMSEWCAREPEMVAHTGLCLVHRAEILEFGGQWTGALAEAGRAAERLRLRPGEGYAHYRRGEVHRLRGETAAAEAAYRDASRCGCEPQPGLALLRLAQGDTAAARSALDRALAETTDALPRARVLSAAVEVMLGADDAEAAAAAADELEAIAGAHGADAVLAMAAHARGAVALAEEDAVDALAALRTAVAAWRELDAPYEVARARVAIGLACRILGDDDSAALEFDAAADAFRELGAAPDLRRLEALAGRPAHGLSARELQVLRLLAAGARNKDIAAELVLSERTVDRHVSNIFAKLRVSSRAAATAYAYEHRLIPPG